MIRALILALTLVVPVLCARSASAQSTVAVAQFREAKKLYDDGQFKDALQLFQLAWEHSHSPNARLYIARCFLALGNLVPAYDEFRGTVRDATDKLSEDEKYKDTQNAAAAELVLLEPKIGHLIVSVDAGDAKDVKVTVNGESFPSVSWGSVVTKAPGSYKVVASAEGRDDVVREVDLGGGKTEAVALYFVPVSEAVAPPPPDPKASEETSLSTLQLVGLITGAVGVGTLVAAAGTGIATGAKFAALESACGDSPCPDPGYTEIVDSGKTLELVTYILLGAGGALTLTGGALWLFGGDGDASATEAGATGLVVPLPGGLWLGASGRF